MTLFQDSQEELELYQVPKTKGQSKEAEKNRVSRKVQSKHSERQGGFLFLKDLLLWGKPSVMCPALWKYPSKMKLLSCPYPVKSEARNYLTELRSKLANCS